jgi:hypothetical protein
MRAQWRHDRAAQGGPASGASSQRRTTGQQHDDSSEHDHGEEEQRESAAPCGSWASTLRCDQLLGNRSLLWSQVVPSVVQVIGAWSA